jgi:ornithine carbamoyltransferase
MLVFHRRDAYTYFFVSAEDHRGIEEMKKKDLLSVTDLSGAGIRRLISTALRMKKDFAQGRGGRPLQGKALGLLFSKPSTRTRVSFEVGMAQLGGTALVLPPSETQLGRGETLEDTARVLSRYLDGLVIRTFEQRELETWARYSTVPVINGLSDFCHPCQVLSDLMTIRERFGRLKGVKVAYIGDGNNVAHSWILAAGLLGLDLTLAVPKGYEPLPSVMTQGRASFSGPGEPPRLCHDPEEAARGADVLYTDVWTSMGQEKERAKRLRAFRRFQINKRLLALAGKGAVVMHCLPAHRDEEITSEVLDSPASIVLQEAENRLHLQKALLVKYLGRK